MTPAAAPIFIVGMGRSGTTLLRLMLSAHPRIYITHETSFYAWESTYSRRKARGDFLDYYFQSSSFRWLDLHQDRILAGLRSPLPRDRVKDAFTAIMREKAADYGRVRFGDKTPAHAFYLKRIFEDYPEARVIHIVRDPRLVAASLLKMPWGSRSLFCNAALCDIVWRVVQKYHNRILEIRLEDLVANPRQVMSGVLDYVGEPWDDAVLDHARHLPDVHDMPPFPWTDGATRSLSSHGTPRASLPAVQLRMIEHVTRRIMKARGYQPAALTREPHRAAVRWEIWRQLPESIRFLCAFGRLRRHVRDPRNFASAETIALWRRLNPPSWEHYPGLERLLIPLEFPSVCSLAAGRSVPRSLTSGTPAGKSDGMHETT